MCAVLSRLRNRPEKFDKLRCVCGEVVVKSVMEGDTHSIKIGSAPRQVPVCQGFKQATRLKIREHDFRTREAVGRRLGG